MAQKAEVELIPWVHYIGLPAQKDVVKYIRELPKNSYLAVELSPKKQVFLSEAMDLLTRKTGLPRTILERFHDPSYWAGLETLHECKKRNITAIPLETPVSVEKSSKLGFGQTHSKKRVAVYIFREQTIARQVQTLLKKFKGKKLHVLSGLTHTISVKRELEKRGIKASINTKIFTEKGKIERLLGMSVRRIKAIQSGRGALAIQIAVSMENLAREGRTEDLTQARERIIRELRKRAKTQAKRAKRKLAEKKKKRIPRTKPRRKPK